MAITPGITELPLKIWKHEAPVVVGPNNLMLLTFAGRMSVHDHIVVVTEATPGMAFPEDYLNRRHSSRVVYLRERHLLTHEKSPAYRAIARYMVQNAETEGWQVRLDRTTLPPYMWHNMAIWPAPRSPVQEPTNVRIWTPEDEVAFEQLQYRAPQAMPENRPTEPGEEPPDLEAALTLTRYYRDLTAAGLSYDIVWRRFDTVRAMMTIGDQAP